MQHAHTPGLLGSLLAPLSRGLAVIAREFRHAFCRHNWQCEVNHRYNVVDKAGHSCGTARITVFACQRCGTHRLIVCDRQPKCAN
jgi:hypothetical protein